MEIWFAAATRSNQEENSSVGMGRGANGICAGAEAVVIVPKRAGATERANHDIALGRGNWTFFGSDSGGKTAAVLRSFVASCKRCGVEPFAWFNDVLARIPVHSIARLTELFPHNWQPATSPC